MWWYWVFQHSLVVGFYVMLAVVLIVIAIAYDVFRVLWPAFAFVWNVLTTALYWPFDKLLDVLHVARADTEEEYEREMDERYP